MEESCDAFLGLQCHLLSPRPGAGDPTGSLGTPALGTRQGETSISASLHSILKDQGRIPRKKNQVKQGKGSAGAKGWSEMRPWGWAGLLGHGDVPTLSQHSRWTQVPCRLRLLFPSGQSDVVSCLLLCLSVSFRSFSQCYPILSLLLAGSVKNLDFPP